MWRAAWRRCWVTSRLRPGVRLAGAASAGAVAVAVALPLAAALAGRPGWEVVAFAAAGLLVVIRHRDNIDRLRRGEEHSLAPESTE